MKTNSKIMVCGAAGMVGSAIVRRLLATGHQNTVEVTRNLCDLTDQEQTNKLFEAYRPSHIFIASAKVGGIGANMKYPADFIYENIMMTANIFEAARRYCRAPKIIYLGSSCIYPKMAPQPIKEEYLLSGPLEPTNDAYAIAKIAGVKMCQAFTKNYPDMVCTPLMPTNLYGPGDRYDEGNSHVIPDMIIKFHKAKESGDESVVLWGDGSPMREFMYVGDCAEACIRAMRFCKTSELLNIGSGDEYSIAEVAKIIRQAIGYKGDVLWDRTKPNGTPRKLLDITKMKERLHFIPETKLYDTIDYVVEDYERRL